jgi:hypothetical protein
MEVGVTLTAIFISLGTFYVSGTSSTSVPECFVGLQMPMWPDNRILVCENPFENAFLKDMIVGVANAPPARCRSLDSSVVELVASRDI